LKEFITVGCGWLSLFLILGKIPGHDISTAGIWTSVETVGWGCSKYASVLPGSPSPRAWVLVRGHRSPARAQSYRAPKMRCSWRHFHLFSVQFCTNCTNFPGAYFVGAVHQQNASWCTLVHNWLLRLKRKRSRNETKQTVAVSFCSLVTAITVLWSSITVV